MRGAQFRIHVYEICLVLLYSLIFVGATNAQTVKITALNNFTTDCNFSSDTLVDNYNSVQKLFNSNQYGWLFN